MKTAVMQPYLFPYLPYWQMVTATDQFVSLDDVNYIKKGWINRNAILLDGEPHQFVLPLSRPSQNKHINETCISMEDKDRKKLLKMIHTAYAKAPFFSRFYPVMESILCDQEKNLAVFLHKHFQKMFAYMNIQINFHTSSTLKKDSTLKGQEKIIEICKRLNTSVYINAIGGRELYDMNRFMRENIELRFIQSRKVSYQQFKQSFVPNLSIIDVLMFNDINSTQVLLKEYDLA